MPRVFLNLVVCGVRVSVDADHWVNALNEGAILLVEKYYEDNPHVTNKEKIGLYSYITSCHLYHQGESVRLDRPIDENMEGKEFVMINPSYRPKSLDKNEEIKVEEIE